MHLISRTLFASPTSRIGLRWQTWPLEQVRLLPPSGHELDVLTWKLNLKSFRVVQTGTILQLTQNKVYLKYRLHRQKH